MHKRFSYMKSANFMNYAGAAKGALALSVPGVVAGLALDGANINSRQTPEEQRLKRAKALRFEDSFNTYQENQTPANNKAFANAGEDFVDYDTSIRNKYSNPLLRYGLPVASLAGGALLGARYIR